jgi:hypothetical protein
VQQRANSVELEIDLRLQGGVVVEGGSTKEPRADNVVVQVGLKRDELLNELQSILDELGVYNLDASDVGGRKVLVDGVDARPLGLGSSNRRAGRSQEETNSELHLESWKNLTPHN